MRKSKLLDAFAVVCVTCIAGIAGCILAAVGLSLAGDDSTAQTVLLAASACLAVAAITGVVADSD